MNRTVLAMLAVIALSGCTARDSAMTNTPPAFSADDESAVRALVDEFANTWNRHDMKAMHELDTEDVEWINVVGHLLAWKGYRVQGPRRDSQGHVREDHHERRIRDNPIDRARRGGGRCDLHFGPSLDPRLSWVVAAKTRGSFTMVKRDGIWKIAHFQNTVIDPKTESDDLPKWDATGFPPPGHPLYDAGRRSR